MHPVLSLALHGMQADMARLDRVAMNLANAQTAGFKRELALAAPFAQRIDAAASAPVVQLDVRPGALRATGRSLDLALAGPGWFEVMTEHGPAYTRQGEFRLDARGRLVTAQGHPVLGTAGEIQLMQTAAVIDARGRVFDGSVQAGDPIAQLKLVLLDPGAPMQRLGNGLVTGAVAGPAAAEVRQGHLEGSNVNPMHEMVQLLQTLRHFESMQKVAVGYDEMLATAIRRLGETG